MKNKLLVSVFASAIAAFAFTSCEPKSNVTEVCTDLVKESMHKSPRSLLERKGESLSISEYEFMGGVNDNRLLYRYIAFGNGTYTPKSVDTLTYTYGDWEEQNTSYYLNVTAANGESYKLVYKGNSFITPDGRVIGGETSDNVARVEKWEKIITSLQNTKWEGLYEGDFVLDSVFRDSVRTRLIGGKYKTDTIRIFVKMDTVAADTSCYYTVEFNHDPATHANTGHFYKKGVRTKYNLQTRTQDTVNVDPKEYDCNWYFESVSSDKRFSVALVSTTPDKTGDLLNISKYDAGDSGKPAEFTCFGANFKRTNP